MTCTLYLFTFLLVLCSCSVSFEETDTTFGLKNHPEAVITISHSDKSVFIHQSGFSRGDERHMQIGDLDEVIHSFLPQVDIYFDGVRNEKIIQLVVDNISRAELESAADGILERLSHSLAINIERTQEEGEVLYLGIENKEKLWKASEETNLKLPVTYVANQALVVGDLNQIGTFLASEILENQVIVKDKVPNGTFRINLEDFSFEGVASTLAQKYGLSLTKGQGTRDVIRVSPK